MKVAVFSTKPYDLKFLNEANSASVFDFTFHESKLGPTTAKLAEGHKAVCAFVNDDLKSETLKILARSGVKMIALRSAGFNNLDLEKLKELGMTAARVPAYSPYAVAEHTFGLILTLNRSLHRAYNRVREMNFALDGLLGFDLHGRTIGVIGTGKIGQVVTRIAGGFGCEVLAHDPYPSSDCQAEYVGLTDLLQRSDIVTLHCPLTPDTHHLIDAASLESMKPGCMLINTSRGALIDTLAVIDGLKSGRVGALGLDVYEEEGDLFFEDLSTKVIKDDVFARLLTFPNVVITGHQAFFTKDALQNIAETTLANLLAFHRGEKGGNEL